ADADLVELVGPFIEEDGLRVGESGRTRLLEGMDGLKQRARTLKELARAAAIYLRPRPLPMDAKAANLLNDSSRPTVEALVLPVASLERGGEAALESSCRATAERLGIGFGKLAQRLRAALTGTTVSPGLFEVMRVLGRGEVLGRIEDAV